MMHDDRYHVTEKEEEGKVMLVGAVERCHSFILFGPVGRSRPSVTRYIMIP